MIIRESFYFWSQHSEPWFVPLEVSNEIGAGVPGVIRNRVEGCEDIEEVFNIHVLRPDPPRFSKLRLVRFEVTR